NRGRGGSVGRDSLRRVVARWRGEVAGNLVGVEVPAQRHRTLAGGLLVVRDVYLDPVGETIVGGRRTAVSGRVARAVLVVQRLGHLVAGDEAGHRVPVPGDRGDAADAGPGDPDRRTWLLVRARPDIDVAVVPRAFPAERAVVGFPGLQDQVVRLPHPLMH